MATVQLTLSVIFRVTWLIWCLRYSVLLVKMDISTIQLNEVLKPIFYLANFFANRQKSRNASYLFAANFFTSQF